MLPRRRWHKRAGRLEDRKVMPAAKCSKRQAAPPELRFGSVIQRFRRCPGEESTIRIHVMRSPPPSRPAPPLIRSRMMNFCILPVTVIGNSSTKRMWRGTL